jgi:hypothetical protein
VVLSHSLPNLFSPLDFASHIVHIYSVEHFKLYAFKLPDIFLGWICILLSFKDIRHTFGITLFKFLSTATLLCDFLSEHSFLGEDLIPVHCESILMKSFVLPFLSIITNNANLTQQQTTNKTVTTGFLIPSAINITLPQLIGGFDYSRGC